ncbi:MAG: patatin-like phospholipase family protein [Acetobacteraceae bacterium]
MTRSRLKLAVFSASTRPGHEYAHRSWAFGRRRPYPALLPMFGLLLALSGCALSREPAPPHGDTDTATVLGIPNARFWADGETTPFIREIQLSAKREAAAFPPGPGGERAPVSFLSLSGGGENGAFGAGLLVGWTASGRRPEFRLVTGVSTGSLIAPFAFLGPSYDNQLRMVFTNISKQNVLESNDLLPAVLFGEALADSSPLYRLIARFANAEMLQAIAREYEKGRLLFIGTTNLDAQRPVIWNIGAIAASGKPGALDLFRRILLASSAIPGAFPPVMINVDVSGRHYQEMHVDGGAVAQAFLYPVRFQLKREAEAVGIKRQRTVYVIRNGRLDADWASTDRHLLSITGRAIATMIHYSGVNDVLRIYATARRDGLRFRLAYIGVDAPDEPHPQFDTAYMRSLFDYAYQKAAHGYPWRTAPPGLEEHANGKRAAPSVSDATSRPSSPETRSGYEGAGARSPRPNLQLGLPTAMPASEFALEAK